MCSTHEKCHCSASSTNNQPLGGDLYVLGLCCCTFNLQSSLKLKNKDREEIGKDKIQYLVQKAKSWSLETDHNLSFTIFQIWGKRHSALAKSALDLYLRWKAKQLTCSNWKRPRRIMSSWWNVILLNPHPCPAPTQTSVAATLLSVLLLANAMLITASRFFFIISFWKMHSE